MFGKAEPIQKRSQLRNLSHLKGIPSVSLEKKLRNPDILQNSIANFIVIFVVCVYNMYIYNMGMGVIPLTKHHSSDFFWVFVPKGSTGDYDYLLDIIIPGRIFRDKHLSFGDYYSPTEDIPVPCSKNVKKGYHQWPWLRKLNWRYRFHIYGLFFRILKFPLISWCLWSSIRWHPDSWGFWLQLIGSPRKNALWLLPKKRYQWI